MLRLTILGCGSSGGVPRVGSGWGACDPDNPKNRRTRCSLLIERHGPNGVTRVLVDTSPDLREQLLRSAVSALNAVVITHEHADHTHGIDDLRPLVIHMRRRIDMFMDERTSALMHERFGYCFATPPGSEYPPIVHEHRIRHGANFAIEGAGGSIDIMPFRLVHGAIDALGLRIGDIAYTPDLSAIPEESLGFLDNLELWIVDALRYTPHPTHFSLSEALYWIEEKKPRRAILTNLHTDLDYAVLAQQIPAHVLPAFDGMVVDGEA